MKKNIVCLNRNQLFEFLLILGLASAYLFPIYTVSGGYQGVSMNQVTLVQSSIEDYTYSTFFGGTDVERIMDIAVDSMGNIVVFGGTYSVDLPTLNPFQGIYGGGEAPEHLFLMGDCFVAKFSEDGALLWSTYLGGSNLDDPEYVLIGDDDEIILLGDTQSEDFPVTDNAIQGVYGGGETDCFLARLTKDGELTYSTYLGGSDEDRAGDFEVEESGSLVIVGRTSSADFPVTLNAFQRELGGETDSFITVITDNQIVYSSFFGGTGIEGASEIALDSYGNIVFTGTTTSDDLPLTDNAFQDTIVGEERDCFVAMFQDYSDLFYATYLGGDHMEDCFGMGIDSSDNIHLVGRTWSGDFPTTPGSIQESYNGIEVDGFYTRLTSEGSMTYSTFYGGDGWDSLFKVAFNGENVIIMGIVNSGGFPLVNAIQNDFMGQIDTVILVMDQENQLTFSTYLGGSQVDQPSGLKISDGKLYLAGQSYSTDFYTTDDAYQESNAGSGDGFIFTIELDDYLHDVDDIQVPNPARTKLLSSIISYVVVLGSIVSWFLIMKRYN